MNVASEYDFWINIKGLIILHFCVLHLRLDRTITAGQGAGGGMARTDFRHDIVNFFIVLSLRQLLSRSIARTKSRNCEIKSHNSLVLFFIQWRKRASIQKAWSVSQKKLAPSTEGPQLFPTDVSLALFSSQHFKSNFSAAMQYTFSRQRSLNIILQWLGVTLSYLQGLNVCVESVAAFSVINKP